MIKMIRPSKRYLSGADPEGGFPVGGGAPYIEAPTYDFAKSSKKLHEIEKFSDCRGRTGYDPLQSASASYSLLNVFRINKVCIIYFAFLMTFTSADIYRFKLYYGDIFLCKKSHI